MTNDREFLNWVADRLVHVYGESPNVDFVRKLREIAEAEKQKEDAVGFCEVLTMDDVADIVVNAQKRTPPYEINYMIVMQLTEKKVLEKFK
jgi:hypothetical protein